MGGRAGNAIRSGVGSIRTSTTVRGLNAQYNRAWNSAQSDAQRRRVNAAFETRKRQLGFR